MSFDSETKFVFMHHGKSQHEKTSNASQSDHLSFVYFSPQLGLNKNHDFSQTVSWRKIIFLGKLGICHLSGIRHFMRRSHFLQTQHFLLQNSIHIYSSQSANHAENSSLAITAFITLKPKLILCFIECPNM